MKKLLTVVLVAVFALVSLAVVAEETAKPVAKATQVETKTVEQKARELCSEKKLAGAELEKCVASKVEELNKKAE